ncbi:hypothetical protein Bca52824_096058 [Brassica carinata]|uniref:Uncharacterized protein n=1 Tax=Brassica carinata TaxID=52824 RepID=A0A8X7THP1_BRACI|nr:hypothetical protein Bca52824_096058 [Brassica carinata]
MIGNSDLEFPNLTLNSRGCDSLLSRPSSQTFTQISILKPPSRMATMNGDGLPVFTSVACLAYGLHFPVVYRSLFGCVYDTSFVYGLNSHVVYRFLMGCVDWSSFSSCFDLPTTPPCKILHAYLSSLFFTYSAIVEWFRELIVWMMLELRFMFLAGDILMDLVSFGSTFATFGSFYIALPRSSAVCSSLTSFNPDVGVVFVYLSSWWQVEEKFIVIFIPVNMDVADYDFSLVPRLNQSSFLIYPPIWSELDEQVSLVLQGFSSHRILSSAYGAVCVVLRVTLDAISEEAYDVVVIQFLIALFVIRIAILSFMLSLFVCLDVYSLFVFSSVRV